MTDVAVRRRDVAAVVMLSGFVAAVLAHYVLSQYYQRDYPESTFLFKPQDNRFADLSEARGVGGHLFGDFFQAWQQSRQPSPYVSEDPYFRSNYPPLLHLVLRPLGALSYSSAVVLYVVVIAASVVALAYFSLPGSRVVRAQTALVIGLLGYPLLLLLDRGNVEGLPFVLVWLALVPKHLPATWLRPLLLGAAAALKIYPVVFLLVLVRRRLWRELALAIAAGGGLTLLGLLVLEGGPVKGLQDMRAGLQAFSAFTSADNAIFVQHSSSLLGAGKVLIQEGLLPAGSLTAVSALRWLLTALLLAAVLVLPLRRWEELFILATLITVTFSVCFDYRLVYFLLPLVLLLRESGVGSSVDLTVAALAVVHVPKSLPLLYEDVSVSTVVNPLLITGIAVAAAARGVGAWSLQRRAAGAPRAGGSASSGGPRSRSPRSAVTSRASTGAGASRAARGRRRK